MNTRTSVITLALAALLGLSSCTGTNQPSASPSASPSTSAADQDRVSPSLQALPSIEIKGGAIRDVVIGECPTAPGKQTVTGTLTSSQAGKQDFLISISWTNANGDIRGRGFEVLRNLARGDTKRLSITAQVAEGATRCVTGVSFGTLDG